MLIERESPCKVNLVLNTLGKRSDGFHELETVIYPVAYHDHLSFERKGSGISLTCSNAELAVDNQNLVYRAAQSFLERAEIKEGVRIHLQKRIPLAAGLGGGSGNAATTLLALNELFGSPVSEDKLQRIAAGLGSDVPFFLQNAPALATGRGEQIKRLVPFRAMDGAALVLIHPGFGIPTAWAYQQLSRFPHVLNGKAGRAQRLIDAMNSEPADLEKACELLYNSLEAPALEKYPLLRLFQDFLRSNGAAGTLMSGSGSTTFAIVRGTAAGNDLVERFKSKFGANNWIAVVGWLQLVTSKHD